MDKAQEKLLNITLATETACKEPTLLDALTWVCVWESERVVKQARTNPQWETCFKVCLQSVLNNYRKLPEGKPPWMNDNRILETLERAYKFTWRQLICDYIKDDLVSPSDVEQFLIELIEGNKRAQRDSDIKWMRGE